MFAEKGRERDRAARHYNAIDMPHVHIITHTQILSNSSKKEQRQRRVAQGTDTNVAPNYYTKSLATLNSFLRDRAGKIPRHFCIFSILCFFVVSE
jgi:hypothetical protein